MAKVALDHGFEIGEDDILNSEPPLEIQAHLVLYLVDLLKVEHALSNDGPWLLM